MTARRPVECVCPPEREGFWCASPWCRNNPATADRLGGPIVADARLLEVLGDRPLYPLDTNDQT
jgi:hypothetical protein